MRIAFTHESLEHEPTFRYLTSIAWMVVDGRHRWSISDHDAFLKSRWLASESPSSRAAFREVAALSARTCLPPALDIASVTDATSYHEGRWRLPAHLAEEYLREPLLVITENARCDGSFLKQVALRVGRKHLERALGAAILERIHARWRGPLGDGEWLQVVHGGGFTTAVQVELAVEARPGGPPRRIFVLVDSDRSAKDGSLGSTASKVQACIQKLQESRGHRIRLHVLHKREVENYLPKEALRQINSASFARWEQMSADDKDYSDLKDRSLFGSKASEAWYDPTYEHYLHEQALRERAGGDGRELSELIRVLGELLIS